MLEMQSVFIHFLDVSCFMHVLVKIIKKATMIK